MPRPRGSGYASQVKLLQALRGAQELSFQSLIYATKLHRNTVACNLKILAAKELVGKRRKGRYVLYRLLDEDKAWSYIEKHTLKLNRILKHPVAKRISKGFYWLGRQAASIRLRPYILELSKQSSYRPYGSKGIEDAKMFRWLHQEPRDRMLKRLSRMARRDLHRSRETVPAKAPLRPYNLLYASALYRLSQGRGDDLDWLIVLLTHLTQYKWQNIQLPEVRYLRPETPEEETLLSELDGDWRRKHEKKRAEMQADYAKWKEHEEEYVNGLRDPAEDGVQNAIVRAPLTILNEKGEIIDRISYFRFKAEERGRFANWRKRMGEPELDSLVRACREYFKDAPSHYLGKVKGMVTHAKIVYAEILWFVSERYKEFARYADLKEVFERINPDIGKAEGFRDCLSEEQLVMEPAAHLKGMQEVMSPWKVTLAL